VKRELTEAVWKALMDKAWNAGIPHVIFTGGEPTLRPDLFALIRHGEDLGMVTGLITDGLRLVDAAYLNELLQSGLDHVMVLVDSQSENCWSALKALLAGDIAVIAHLTLRAGDLHVLNETLDRLVEMGVQTVSLSAESPDLNPALQSARQVLADRQLRLVWDLPVPYSKFHPVAMEISEEGDGTLLEEGDGRAWLYVEPDGDVLPGQGAYQTVLGNLLTDSWEKVWKAARSSTPNGVETA
jgi:MoaA/NifB/PqqE/SkfB family radical SAM enzyme